MQSYKKIFLVFLVSVLVAGIFAFAAISYFNIPERIVMLSDEKPDFGPFYSMELAGQSGVLKNNTVAKEKILDDGIYDGKLKMFGLVDVKDVKINIDTNLELIPCGNAIGVKLYTDGILVVGLSEFEGENGQKQSPAKKSGVKKGDLIKKINNKNVYTIDDFVLECDKSPTVKLEILRNGKLININVKSEKSKSDGKNKLGLWVRDSTAGIGTMTFYNPKTKSYAALGHGITDIDTESILPVKDGEVLSASIVSVKKGEKGSPGELHGVFLESAGKIGTVNDNNKFGIYGSIKNDAMLTNNQAIKVASKEEVTEGKAYILSNIGGQKVKKFEVQIQKKFTQNGNSTKGMIIKITDKELIKKTGGIVQGMSGSPVIQNGKLVGAVTHVFVNDPTRGYGIFIENMLAEAEKIK